MTVQLMWATPEADKQISFMARVSNPDNQDNEEFKRLLNYLMKHNHVSPFEMASMCVQIDTTRDISRQILRHRSFSFQEFSQRYAASTSNEIYEARRQDTKNRQNSINDMSTDDKDWFLDAQTQVWDKCFTLYQEGLKRNIAKEQMRFILPLSTSTTIYMNGNLRAWITYLLVRLDKSTQLEHRQIAEECWNIFQSQFPTISKAVKENHPEIFK